MVWEKIAPRMEGFYICLILTLILFLKNCYQAKTSPLDWVWGHVKLPAVPSRKKGIDSWRILPQKFPVALTRRSASYLLQRGRLPPPIWCFVHKAREMPLIKFKEPEELS